MIKVNILFIHPHRVATTQ